jgi:hypothetical protein
MDFSQIREQQIDKMRTDNLKLFYENLISEKLSEKERIRIQNRFKKYSFIFSSFDNYIQFLKSDIKNCIGLESDPSKQQIDEKLQIDFFNEKYKRNIKKLPASGKSSFCINKKTNQICSTDGLDSIKERTKTFDAIEKDNGKTIYYVIKYTNENGGAQDNQVQDINIFYEQIEKYVKANPYSMIDFVFILAGKKLQVFYQMHKEIFNSRIQLYFLD